MPIIMPERWVTFNEPYQVSDEGRFRRKLKNGSYRYIIPYRKFTCPTNIVIKIRGKEINCRRTVWEAFNGPIPENHVIVNKYGFVTNLDVYSLDCIPRVIRNRQTAGMSKGRRVKDLETGKVYESAKQAAEELFMSRTTVCDICNKRYKTQLRRLKWED